MKRLSVKRLIGGTLYYAFAQFLPSTETPLIGKTCKKLRAMTCMLFFDKCGHHINVEPRAYVGLNHVIIGNGSGIGKNFHLQGGNLTIGNHVMMAPNVTILCQGHRFERKDMLIGRQGNYPKGHIYIGDDVWIGRNVTILPGCKKIGTGCVIGACSVVTKDVPDYEVWAGNPAKLIKRRE